MVVTRHQIYAHPRTHKTYKPHPEKPPLIKPKPDSSMPKHIRSKFSWVTEQKQTRVGARGERGAVGSDAIVTREWKSMQQLPNSHSGSHTAKKPISSAFLEAAAAACSIQADLPTQMGVLMQAACILILSKKLAQLFSVLKRDVT